MTELSSNDLIAFKKDFFEKCKAAFIDGLNLLKENENKEKDKFNYSRYYDFPIIQTFESGFPYFTKLKWEKIDYSSLFTEKNRYSSIQSWNDWHYFLINNE